VPHVTERDVIICKCGYWNRLSDQKRWWRRFACEKCGQRLPWPPSGPRFSASLVAFLLLAGGALGLTYFETQTVAPKVATATPPPLKGRDAERPANIQNPPTGVTERSRKKNAIATFAVETDAGSDYLVKLVNMSDPKDQLVIYVRGGETYSTKVPLGRYHVRAATGTTWHGKNDLFGPETRFFRFIDQSPTST
jgi:hypothetical protein